MDALENRINFGDTRTLVVYRTTADAILPPKKMRTWDWCCEYAVTHKGDPFNGDLFPWCEGICDYWDSPHCKRIFYRAGSRLGKTEINLAMHMAAQDMDPDIGMFGAPTEGLLKKTIKDRYYKMLDKSPKTKGYCPPEYKQGSHKVKTDTYITYGGWSGSPTTLGDIDPRYVNLLEASKWTKASSEEADPLELAMQRGAEIPGRKLIAESTPTIEGICRISRFVDAATNRHFYVPCPKCGAYHPLEANGGDDPLKGGLWWDRDKDGKSNGNRAFTSARYICPTCKQEWGEEYRRPSVRRGVWVAPGETIDKKGRITGEPINKGPDESFNLSRMYGPTFSFGDYAREYATCMGQDGEQDFLNNWAGVTFVPVKVQMTWSQLAKRLCVGTWQRGKLPSDVLFITTAVDVQDDHFVLAVFGWNCEKTGYLIQHGIAHTWEEVGDWTNQFYEHEDGGEPMRSTITTIDAKDGNRKDEVIDFCCSANNEHGPFIWPSMGMKSGNLGYSWFKKEQIDEEYKIIKAKDKSADAIGGMYWVKVNTTITQEWLDNCLGRRRPGNPHSIVIHEDVATDQDLFEQLLNEVYNPEKGLWARVDVATIPVDLRDCFRYARCSAEVSVNGKWERLPARRRKKVVSEETIAQQQIAASRARERRSSKENKSAKKSFVRKPERAGGKNRRFIRR